jgi:hypothetical protein
MKKVDLYLPKPINVLGKNGTSYPNVVHIDTTSRTGDGYIEDNAGEILFLSEMDNLMKTNVGLLIEQYTSAS